MKSKVILEYRSSERNDVYKILGNTSIPFEIVKDKRSELDVSSKLTLIINPEDLMKLLYTLNAHTCFGVRLVKIKRIRERRRKNENPIHLL